MNTTLLALSLVTWMAASDVVGQSASATVVMGGEHCRTIDFPGGWEVSAEFKHSGYLTRFRYENGYEFRSAGDNTLDYLVRAFAPVTVANTLPEDYSANQFRVDLRSGKVRRASQEEWESSVVIAQSEGVKPELPEPGATGIAFAEKVFRKSGPQWPFALAYARFSLDDKWIAVQSWEGKDYSNGDIVAPRGGHGKFFVDLYEVSSGAKLVAIEGADKGWLTGDVPLHCTFWLESRYFIVHLGSHLERILVCEVPDAVSKGAR